MILNSNGILELAIQVVRFGNAGGMRPEQSLAWTQTMVQGAMLRSETLEQETALEKMLLKTLKWTARPLSLAPVTLTLVPAAF